MPTTRPTATAPTLNAINMIFQETLVSRMGRARRSRARATTADTYNFTVKVTDSGIPAQSATKALSI